MSLETYNPTLRVGVVDGDTLSRSTLDVMLGRFGAVTLYCETATEIIQTLNTCRVDVILIDFDLKPISGLTIARLIRFIEGHGLETTIVGYAAACTPELTHEAKQAGVQEVLAKPLRMQQLESLLRWERTDRRPTVRIGA